MNRYTRGWVVFLLMGLAGCAHYAPKPLPATVALDDLATQPMLPPLTMAAVVQRAVVHNPDLVAMRAQHSVAEAQLMQAGVLPNPSVSASASSVLAGAGVVTALSVGVMQDLKSVLLRESKQASGQASVQALDARILWQEWQVMTQARLLAVALIEGGHQMAVLATTVAVLDERVTREARAVAQGDLTLALLTPDQAAASDAHRQMDDLARQLAARRQELSALMGVRSDAVWLLEDRLEIPKVDADALREARETLASRRPDLLALQWGYAAQEERLRGAVLAQFPSLLIGINAGRDTSDVRTLGPQLSFDLPIFDRNQGAIANETATRQQLYDEYVARLASAQNDLTTLLARQQQLRAQVEALGGRLVALQKSAEQAEAAFHRGDLDLRSYVELKMAAQSRALEKMGMEQALLEGQVAMAALAGVGLPALRFAPAQEAP